MNKNKNLSIILTAMLCDTMAQDKVGQHEATGYGSGDSTTISRRGAWDIGNACPF
jgi:hypothetical protein